MRQLAWLDYYRGKWPLATSNPLGPIRRWTDRDAALSELADEGWMITGPYPKKRSCEVNSGWELHGYSLTRLLY